MHLLLYPLAAGLLCGPLSQQNGSDTLVCKPYPTTGLASWYGEQHRGKLMANGRPFDPSQLTGASWFYPLGAKVTVARAATGAADTARHAVTVTISDRGPSRAFVRRGRIIDLSRAAFSALANPEQGLVEVVVCEAQSE